VVIRGTATVLEKVETFKNGSKTSLLEVRDLRVGSVEFYSIVPSILEECAVDVSELLERAG